MESASVRIDLPPGVEPADIKITGGTVQEQPDGSLLMVKEGPITSYSPWEFSVTLPAGATTATKPQWQQDIETAAIVAQAAQARRAGSSCCLAVWAWRSSPSACSACC